MFLYSLIAEESVCLSEVSSRKVNLASSHLKEISVSNMGSHFVGSHKPFVFWIDKDKEKKW